jgi:phosphomannomutase
MTGIALLLELLCEDGLTLSQQKASLPTYHLHKKKLPLQGIDLTALSDVLQKQFTGWQLDQRDGYHLSRPGEWLQLRASNTEPVIRLFVEAGDETSAKQLAAKVEHIIKPT